MRQFDGTLVLIWSRAMKNYSLEYALSLWRRSDNAKDIPKAVERHLSIALRLYVFPEILPEYQPVKARQFASICTTLPIQSLHNSLEVFDRKTDTAITQNKISKQTRDNYRSALGRFIKWLQKQVWWQETVPQSINQQNVAPFRSRIEQKITKGKLPSYGLTMDQLPQHVLEELDSYKQFRLDGGKSQRRSWRERKQAGTGRTRKPRVEPVKLATYEKDEQAVLRFSGWYTRAYPGQELHLALLTDEELLDNYAYWSVEHRNVSYSTAAKMVGVGIAIAKWLNYDHATRRNWFDVPLVLELQDLQREYVEWYEEEKHRALAEKWFQKKLTHEQARQVVQYLQKLCAPNYGKHHPITREFLSHGTRSLSAVARAWQTYLLVKILVYCPIRQEEIRNWRLGETLFRKIDAEGEPYYEVRLKEHKRSSLTRRDRHYRLPSILTADLDLWVEKWRPLIVEAVSTLENWTEFWGYGGGKIQRFQERLEKAQQGMVSERVTNSIDQYIRQETSRLQGAQNRVAAWPTAKANLEKHNFLFFVLAKREPTSFGKPHYVASVWRLVNRAIAQGTKALFREERWTNPHALRHIAEAHIRLCGKSHIAEAFGTLIGHSKEMGDAYADQVISEYELTEGIVDNWWI